MLPLAFDPGQRWEYGVNIDWIGKAVERVSGQRLGDYFVRLAQRAEERQPAIADMVAGRAVIEEPNHLESEFPVFEHLVRDKLAKIGGTDNQHSFQPDSGLPAPFERFANELA